MKTIKKIMTMAAVGILLLSIGACTQKDAANAEESKGEVTFGLTSWTCTQPPTEIARILLENEGYEVEFVRAEQPLIWAGIQKKDLHFFMDAWLPYTEEAMWEEYKDKLIKVATSYEEAPLGWVVPTYVEEDSILDLKGKADKFDGKIIGISSGAAMTTISEEMVESYGLEGFEVQKSSEAAMMASAKAAMDKKEPIVFFGWRPHAMFTQFDLKFLDEPKNHFKSDNVYVISYKGIQEDYPEVYDIMSRWSIDVAELEAMMYRQEHEDITWRELAQEWIDSHPEQVKYILGK